MAFKNIEDIMAMAKARNKKARLAVAAAQDKHTLEAVMMAKNDGFVDPVLVGDKAVIEDMLRSMGETIDENAIIDIPDPLEAAKVAVGLARDDKADLLMKGKLNTSEILKAVLNKENGLPHGPLLVDMAVIQHPGYHKILVICDGGIIPYPTLEQKVLEIKMVTEAMHNMGYGDDIKVGVLCAAESVNPKIIESADAAELKRMYQQGEFEGCVLEGPISLDLAMSREAVEIKGYQSPVAGDVDFLLMPNLATGNVYSKSIEMMGAVLIPVVLGAKVPIALSSRSATKMEKYYSLVVGSAMTGEK